MSDDLSELYGNYAPVVMPEFGETPLQGMKSLADTIYYAPGCSNVTCSVYNSTAVKIASQAADVVVVSLGTGTHFTIYSRANVIHVIVFRYSFLEAHTKCITVVFICHS